MAGWGGMSLSLWRSGIMHDFGRFALAVWDAYNVGMAYLRHYRSWHGVCMLYHRSLGGGGRWARVAAWVTQAGFNLTHDSGPSKVS